jgi:hypothetical protein
MSGISAVRVWRSDQHYFQLSLHSQSQLLTEKIKAVRRAGTVPLETIQRIEAGVPFFVGAWGAQK